MTNAPEHLQMHTTNGGMPGFVMKTKNEYFKA